MDEGLTERPSESKRLVLTSLSHQLQPAAWLGKIPTTVSSRPPSTNWVCQRSSKGGSARPRPSQWESLLWAGGSESPVEAGATESFTANTRPVIHHSNVVLHSRRGVAWMKNIELGHRSTHSDFTGLHRRVSTYIIILCFCR